MEKLLNWITIKNNDEWLADMRGNLSLVATLIATIRFQNAINTPGGVRLTPESGKVQCPKILDGNPCSGQSILALI